MRILRNLLIIPLLHSISFVVKSQSLAESKILMSAVPSVPDGYKILNSDSGPGYAEIHYSKFIKTNIDPDPGTDGRFLLLNVFITDVSPEKEYALKRMNITSENEKAVKVKGKYDGVESIDK